MFCVKLGTLKKAVAGSRKFSFCIIYTFLINFFETQSLFLLYIKSCRLSRVLAFVKYSILLYSVSMERFEVIYLTVHLLAVRKQFDFNITLRYLGVIEHVNVSRRVFS